MSSLVSHTAEREQESVVVTHSTRTIQHCTPLGTTSQDLAVPTIRAREVVTPVLYNTAPAHLQFKCCHPLLVLHLSSLCPLLTDERPFNESEQVGEARVLFVKDNTRALGAHLCHSGDCLDCCMPAELVFVCMGAAKGELAYTIHGDEQLMPPTVTPPKESP